MVDVHIVCNERHLMELHADGSPAIKIPRETIRRLTLANGSLSERPLLETLFGAVLLCGGFGIILSLGLPGSRMGPRTFVIGLLLAVVGVFALISGLKRGDFLRVETTSGVRKLRLRRDMDVGRMLEGLRAEGFAVET